MKQIIFTVSLFCCCNLLAAQPRVFTPVKPVQNVASVRPVAVNTLQVAYDFSKVKICVDKQPATNISLPPRKTTAGNAIPKINRDGTLSQVGTTQQALTSATEKMWDPGDVITVYLDTYNGSDWIRNRVRNYAKEWEKYANITFNFIPDFKAAKIKVGFYPTNQSWSWLGRDVNYNPLSNYTMNFGWFDGSTSEDEFSRTITHEFGHALGLLHEHQSPASPLKFDMQKLYAYFKKSDNWDAAQVDAQIVNKYSQSNTNFSSYDPNSIMHYLIPQDLLTSGSSNAYQNSYLSGTDKQYAKAWYPFPPKGVNTSGNLRTNDDCDDVAFKVEYNAVPEGVVEFVFQLGEANAKKVTWWKQVGIPKTNGTETFLWLQDDKTNSTQQISINDINANKGISFWKAKGLGVHTVLNYKWNVLPAIKSGCRITLVWNRDSCN